jgi:hypothetical protein
MPNEKSKHPSAVSQSQDARPLRQVWLHNFVQDDLSAPTLPLSLTPLSIFRPKFRIFSKEVIGSGKLQRFDIFFAESFVFARCILTGSKSNWLRLLLNLGANQIRPSS